ncbi:MAG: hypothetical protein K2Y21_05540 [Phycisphaerales bacterium]|nr:hypothetical protein [Phycisphaerales bacterium]
MAETLGNSWLVVVALSLAGVLAVLYTMASVIRNQSYIHDLQVNVARLRSEYFARMKALQDAAQSGVVELSPAETRPQAKVHHAPAAPKAAAKPAEHKH